LTFVLAPDGVRRRLDCSAPLQVHAGRPCESNASTILRDVLAKLGDCDLDRRDAASLAALYMVA
jgi:hypothetical protein